MTMQHLPFRRTLHLCRIIFLRRIVDLERRWNLDGNDCLIMLIAWIDVLHVFESAELPLATIVNENRPN